MQVHHDWNYIEVGVVEHLFCNVIEAQRVFKSDDELVIAAHHFPAILLLAPFASQVAATAVDVHGFVVLKPLNKFIATALGFTIGSDPNNHFGFTLCVILFINRINNKPI